MNGKKYVLKLQETGFNCFFCFDCEFANGNGFRGGVPDDVFFEEVEKAFNAGKEEYNLLLKMFHLAVDDKLGIGANDVKLKATYMTELKRRAENERGNK